MVGQRLWIRGVIRGVLLGITMDKVTRNLEGDKVVEARHLKGLEMEVE